jgi:predicted DNA-binding transcriptional regulator YafY
MRKPTARLAGCSGQAVSGIELIMKRPKAKRRKKDRHEDRNTDMIPNILQLLTTAIREKRCVAIRYHDQRHVRVIEPHVIYTHETGELVVEAYQTRGYSASGRPAPFWRPFRLKKITAVSLLKENFETRAREGFAREKEKYQHGLVAMIDDRRFARTAPVAAAAKTRSKTVTTPSTLYTVPQPDDAGPQLPKNPYRR